MADTVWFGCRALREHLSNSDEGLTIEKAIGCDDP